MSHLINKVSFSWMRAALAALIPYLYLSFCLLPSAVAQDTAVVQNPLFGFNPATLSSDKANRVFYEARGFGTHNALSLRSLLFDHMKGPFTPDTINRLDAAWNTNSGFVYHGLRWATFYRGEVYMKANRDTIEILRMLNLKKDLPVGRVFTIDLQSRGFSAFGLEVSKGLTVNHMISGLAIGFTARYLQGEKIQEGKIGGQVTPTSQKSYDLDLFMDYIYDKNLLYERQSTIPGTGRGYSFDLGLQYSLSRRFSAQVLFRDIGGRIYWKDSPYTTADAASDITGHDSEGYQTYRPTIQGYESYKNYTQKIPLKTDVLFSCRKGPVTVTPIINFVEGARPFYWIDLHCRATQYLSFHTGYNLTGQAFSLGAHYRKVLLSVVGDDIDLSKIKVIGLALSLSCQ